jgi:hypothetical protein
MLITATVPTAMSAQVIRQGAWNIGTLAVGQTATLTLTIQQAGQQTTQNNNSYLMTVIGTTNNPNPNFQGGVTFTSAP